MTAHSDWSSCSHKDIYGLWLGKGSAAATNKQLCWLVYCLTAASPTELDLKSKYICLDIRSDKIRPDHHSPLSWVRVDPLSRHFDKIPSLRQSSRCCWTADWAVIHSLSALQREEVQPAVVHTLLLFKEVFPFPEISCVPLASDFKIKAPHHQITPPLDSLFVDLVSSSADMSHTHDSLVSLSLPPSLLLAAPQRGLFTVKPGGWNRK